MPMPMPSLVFHDATGWPCRWRRRGECGGLFIIMIYISPLMSSVCFAIFGCFCRLGCCGVHVLVNTSFLYRIGQVHKFAGFLCLCITFRLCLLVQYVFLLGQWCKPVFRSSRFCTYLKLCEFNCKGVFS